MTKEELQRISSNNKRIAANKEKYATLLFRSQAKGQVLTGMPHVSGTSDNVGDYVTELTELRNYIAMLEADNSLLIMKARRFISQVPDQVIRMILELKYINNLYSEDIIGCIGINEIRTEKDLNKLLNTFFLESLLYML